MTRLQQQMTYLSTGLVVVLVGYTSSVAIVLQAAQVAGADGQQAASWLWALGIGMGLSSFALSLYYRQPIVTAWSTPGAALLVTALQGVPLSEAIGAFILCALLSLLVGISGGLERLMRWIPSALANALLAGVLLPFGLQAFAALETDLALAGGMLLGYFVLKWLSPRLAIIGTLLLGLALCWQQQRLQLESWQWQWTWPVWQAPSWSLNSLISVALPLFVVNMASQNLPGLAVLRAHGYRAPASALVSHTSWVSLLLSPFGGFSITLSSITAALCMSPEVDARADQRYRAALWAGVFYTLLGLLGAAVVAFFLALPKALIAAIAGLALLGPIAQSLHQALAQAPQRDAALVTFLVTASGLTLLGIGSAFWGLCLGLLAYHVGRWRQKEASIA